MAQQTAVSFLIEQLKGYEDDGKDFLFNGIISSELIEQAKEMENQQHGDTWDAAIQAHMNQHDVMRLALVLAVHAEVEGMKAENSTRIFDQRYTMEDFEKKAIELRNLTHAHNEQL